MKLVGRNIDAPLMQLSMEQIESLEPAEAQSELRLLVSVAADGKLPSYATQGAAGLDLCSAEDFELAPMQRRCVSTGLRVAIPQGYEGQVRPRSGLALKMGLGMVNSVGTIDSDYRGEIRVLLINFGSEIVTISRGERIAQMVVCPVTHVEVVQVEQIPMDTVRGEGGFGSTGK
ncbi:MAG TPA: dUTP diphosphatase [Fimbriimonadaceae bacterium]|jgi:dUTP pyrophosphatase